jgi:hypothetical protein
MGHDSTAYNTGMVHIAGSQFTEHRSSEKKEKKEKMPKK